LRAWPKVTYRRKYKEDNCRPLHDCPRDALWVTEKVQGGKVCKRGTRVPTLPAPNGPKTVCLARGTCHPVRPPYEGSFQKDCADDECHETRHAHLCGSSFFLYTGQSFRVPLCNETVLPPIVAFARFYSRPPRIGVPERPTHPNATGHCVKTCKCYYIVDPQLWSSGGNERGWPLGEPGRRKHRSGVSEANGTKSATSPGTRASRGFQGAVVSVVPRDARENSPVKAPGVDDSRGPAALLARFAHCGACGTGVRPPLRPLSFPPYPKSAGNDHVE
jgi:hypothetical protein